MLCYQEFLLFAVHFVDSLLRVSLLCGKSHCFVTRLRFVVLARDLVLQLQSGHCNDGNVHQRAISMAGMRTGRILREQADCKRSTLSL